MWSWGLTGVALCSTLMGAMAPAAHAVPIQVTYTDGPGEGFNDSSLGAARRNAFEAAASNWAQRLPGSIPIVVTAAMDSLGGSLNSATLGSAGPTDFFAHSTGLPQPELYYPVALANQLTGQDLNQGAAEIDAQFNSDVDNNSVLGTDSFYYGLDGRPPGNDIDFYSVVLHELCHGLGFLDSLNRNGSYSLAGPDIFDSFEATGSSLNDPRVVSLSQSARAAALISNALFFAGPNANAAGGGVNPKLYAPNPYENGSTGAHLDEDTYSGANELMTPVSSGVAHAPGPLVTGIMADLGWRSTSSTPTPTPVPGVTPAPTATPVPVANRPRNDNFANAQVISGATGRVTGSNVNATKETGEPSHAPDRNPGGKSIWYRWTAPGSGRATFTTAGSSFDTVLAIYTGTAVNALVALASGKNDDASGTLVTSSLTVDVTAGTTYNIAVDGFNNGPGADSGAVTLNWTFTAGVPANNNFANAQVITGATGRVTGSNANATKETGEPAHAANAGGKSVWYRWTAPSTGRATFTTSGSGFNTLLAVYTGTTVNALRLVAANDNISTSNVTSSVTFSVVAGTIYRIAVDGFKATATGVAASGNLVLNWASGPANDNFANAQVISGAAGRVTGSNVGAAKETGEPSHSPDGDIGGKSVWYRWTAPGTGNLILTTAGSNFDTILAIYSGSAVNALTALPAGKNDDVASGVSTSKVTVRVTTGTVYRIAVDGYNATTVLSSAGSGNVVLNWAFTPAAASTLTTAAAVAAAPVQLSTVSANAGTGLVRLRFGGALDAASASDAASYTVAINGHAVAAESAAYAANDHSVTLALPAAALRLGDQVTVAWKLQDAQDRLVVGAVSTVAGTR